MIPPSELILRPDGSLYHLHLLPGQAADTIITVGDPERVSRVSRRFDRIELKVEAREFVTHTGTLDGHRLTVISTGIGTDNVDIVLNELDALFNIDLEARQVKDDLTSLTILRLGTSGAFQPDLPLDALLLSTAALGGDGLMPYYLPTQTADPIAMALSTFLADAGQALPVEPAVVRPVLPDSLTPAPNDILTGMTLTAAGFYAPQGRSLRLPTRMTPELLATLRAFTVGDLRITNLEMETAGIYGLASALGHRSASLSALLANRAEGTFSKDPSAAVERLIGRGLELLVAP